MPPRRSQRWIPISVILILPLVLFWPLVFGGEVLYWGTPLLQFYPWRKLAVDMVRSGHVPLWNHYLGNGTPLAANLQSAVFYPLNLIYLVIPVERAMGYSAVLHVILAGLLMYLYGRTIRLSRFASLVAALSYMFSGFLVSRLGFLSMTSAAPWLPLLFCLAERLVSNRRLSSALHLGLVIGLQLLAGHAQLWYYGLWAVAAYGLARGWQFCKMQQGARETQDKSSAGAYRSWNVERKRGQRRSSRREATYRDQAGCLESRSLGFDALRYSTGARCPKICIRPFSVLHLASSAVRAWLWLALAVLVGLGVAAVQLLPTAELALLSQRQSGAEYEFAMTYSFWPWRLLTLFAPDFFGNPARGDYWGYATYWEDCGYIGLLPLLLALIAISTYLGQRRRQGTVPPLSHITLHASLVPFFSLLSLLSLLLALGKNLPLYPLVFRWVPGFGFFQAPARFLYLYTLGMATLAGLGADLIAPSRRLERVSGYGIVVGLAILLATIAVRLLPFPPVKLTFVSASARFATLLTIASLLLLYRRKAEFRSRKTRAMIKLSYCFGLSPFVLWQTLVIAFIAADLILFGHALNPTTEPRLYELPSTSGALLKREDEGYRTFTFSGSDYDLKFKRYLLFDDFGPDDVGWLMELRETLMPNLAVGEGLFSANNFDPLLIGQYERLMQEIDKGLPRQIDQDLGRTVDKSRLPAALRLLSLMNVKYIFDYGEIPSLRLISADGVWIYRNDYALPRAYVVSQAQVISDDEELLAELLSPTFDPHRTVLLRPSPGQEPIPYPLSLVSLSPQYSPNAVEIEVTLDRDGYLVLSDTYYPGWRAYVDGEEKEILRANYAFRAVPLESGQHTVLFKYDPLSFKMGLAVSLITWGAIILSLVLLRPSDPSTPFTPQYYP